MTVPRRSLLAGESSPPETRNRNPFLLAARPAPIAPANTSLPGAKDKPRVQLDGHSGYNWTKVKNANGRIMSTQSDDGYIYRYITPALNDALADTPVVCLPGPQQASMQKTAMACSGWAGSRGPASRVDSCFTTATPCCPSTASKTSWPRRWKNSGADRSATNPASVGARSQANTRLSKPETVVS